MSDKLKAGLFCLEVYRSACGIFGDFIGLLAYLIATILCLPLLPFVFIASAVCPSKEKSDPEERDGLISKERKERESRERMDAYFDRLGKAKDDLIDLRL
tara:strand:+ start:194 stop:493 length:300 start_codon:yes stop_codon:yes gene_type:complete